MKATLAAAGPARHRGMPSPGAASIFVTAAAVVVAVAAALMCAHGMVGPGLGLAYAAAADDDDDGTSSLAPSPAPDSSAMADHVVINEAETNPPGSDAARVGEWVELYNPTGSAVDIGDWQVASTTGLKKTLTIPAGAVIGPGQFVTFTHQTLWFTDTGETILLRDSSGNVIDSTVRITDTAGDARSWQRSYDAHGAWMLDRPTPGFSNGAAGPQKETADLHIAVAADRESYLFGQTAVITGNVSERIFTEKPTFMAQKVVIHITGEGYDETVLVYPDARLQFSTTVSLQRALGVAGGTYEVSAVYADAAASTSFSVGTEVLEDAATVLHDLSVESDSLQYVPGQYVMITATTQEPVQFATFSIHVKAPSGAVIFTGNPAPVDGTATTSFLLSAVSPEYGTHTITAEYADMTATREFEVSPKTGGSAPMELALDAQSYLPGDTAVISGKLTGVWVQSLDVKVVLAGQGAVTGKGAASYSTYKINDIVDVAGDGAFSYELGIPSDTEGPADYKATFSSDAVSAGIVIPVAGDSGQSVLRDLPLAIYTDRQSYIQGEIVTLWGHVADVAARDTHEYAAASSPVSIVISDQNGDTVGFSANQEHLRRTVIANEGVVGYEFSAVPDESGRYESEMRVHAQLFDEGNYTATATYLEHTATAEFSVAPPYAVSSPELHTDKEVYGLGETVNLSGVLPATGANHVSITLTKPDGVTVRDAAELEGQRFSWAWDAPRVDRTPSIKDDPLRGPNLSVFGVYRVTVSTDTHTGVTYFKLSDNPQSDSLAMDPVSVTTSEPAYRTGDDLVVSGEVVLYEQGGEGLHAPPRVQVIVKQDSFPFKNIYESWLYPDSGGAFSAQFDLPVGLFEEGTYRVTASYGPARSVTTFAVADNYVASSGDPISISVGTDRPTYAPGQTATITGGPNKIIYIKEYIVSVHKMTGSEVDCGTAICGAHRGPTTRIGPDPTASFTHLFDIPRGADAVGTYEVTAESQFGIERVTFEVVQPAPPEIIIQKHNRLPGSEFEIRAHEDPALDYEGTTVAAVPVSVTGIVVAPLGEEAGVNLRVSTGDGECIIGQAGDCAISESTASRGQVFDTVQLADGSSVAVIYSGAGERAERFSIFPSEDGQGRLPDATWNVSIIKEDQVSRFYYKVTYRTS